MLFKGLNFDFVCLQNQSDSVYSSHWWKSWLDFDGFSKMWKVTKNCSLSKRSSWVPFPIPRPDRHDLCLQDIQEVSHPHRTNWGLLVWSEASKVELFSSRYPDIEWVTTSSTPWIEAKIANISPTFCFPKDSSGSWCFVAFVVILMIAANTVIVKTMFNDLFLGSYHFHFSTTFFPAFLSFPRRKKNVQVTYQIGGSGSGVTVGLGVLSWGLFGGFCWYWSNGVWWQISTKPWKPKHSQKNAEFGNLGGSKHHSKPPKNPAGNDPSTNWRQSLAAVFYI